jgi:hypothetical protein
MTREKESDGKIDKTRAPRNIVPPIRILHA